MRIERIELDGFGHFAASHWDLNEGVTVLYGANEAGKTTLLNAIRALLFGFESSREGRAWYPALLGGRRGGRLALRTGAGERWTVERHGERGGLGAVVVEAPNGNRGGQEELNRLLGGADRDLFRNIFAFGLGELESFSSLSGEGIRSRIYGAGSGLGGTSVVEIERRLRGEQEAIFRSARAQEQTLARLLARMEELRATIAELERQPEEYGVARDELGRVRADRDRLRADRIAAIERREHLRRLIAAQEPAGRLAALEQELGPPDPALDDLPTDAEAALDRLMAACQEAGSVLAQVSQSLTDAQRRRSAIRENAPLLDHLAEIEALRDERVTHQERATQLAGADAALARRDAEIAAELHRVGGWSEERLLAIDDSIPALERMRALDERLRQAVATHERIGQRLDNASRELEAIGGAEHDAELPELESLAERRATLAAVLDAPDIRRGGPTPSWVAAVVALTGLLAGSLVGVYLDLQPAGSIAGAVLGLVVAAWLAVRRPDAGPPGSRGELLTRAGLPADAGGSTVMRAMDELAQLQATARSAVERNARVADRRAAVAALEDEAGRAAAAHEAAMEQWNVWLDGQGVPRDVSADAVRQVLDAARAVRRLVIERAEQADRLTTLRAAMSAYDARLDELLAKLGRQVPADAALRASSIVTLAAEAQEAAADHGRARDLDESLAELRDRHAAAERDAVEAQTALADHLAADRAHDVDGLRTRARTAATRRALRQQIREQRAALVALAGSEAALPALLAEAAASDPAQLEAQREAAATEVERLESAEADALTHEGELQATIAGLETDTALGAARQELAFVQARADEEAHDWSVRSLALALLAETRHRYERERQPAVVRDAERYFARITDGRYPRIVAPPDGEAVRVEADEGGARTTDELSRGTAEQLYLALRFGLIEQFARSAEPLPVVMDDILVNFDRRRAGHAASAIRDLAMRHQVIYFTCHRDTVELLDPDGVATIELG